MERDRRFSATMHSTPPPSSCSVCHVRGLISEFPKPPRQAFHYAEIERSSDTIHDDVKGYRKTMDALFAQQKGLRVSVQQPHKRSVGNLDARCDHEREHKHRKKT
jgi:hypothetical protein